MSAVTKTNNHFNGWLDQQTVKLAERPAVVGYQASVVQIQQVATGPQYQLSFNGVAPCLATIAEGLLVSPDIGDTVLCVEVDTECIITQVLKRSKPAETLVLHSTRPVEWVAPILRFKALQEMELLSAKKLTMSACHLVLGAGQTLIQQARNFLQNASHFSLTTKGLMRLNGKQQVIVAEEDIRMDAKRINMG
ncbi:hypothetical protein AB835_11570 [Candidatus Endobugula sertula]|uniref:DUF3540 domain-containing protein n=1 Tax=Candidatus Endobugula sertula TaxID=62101 RepID=A0A1D2QMY3_9GAMM|nr:hypothetical protein AB835_11570 [Candidatus Endobugula sertula]